MTICIECTRVLNSSNSLCPRFVSYNCLITNFSKNLFTKDQTQTPKLVNKSNKIRAL